MWVLAARQIPTSSFTPKASEAPPDAVGPSPRSVSVDGARFLGSAANVPYSHASRLGYGAGSAKMNATPSSRGESSSQASHWV